MPARILRLLCTWLAVALPGMTAADDAYLFPESVYAGDIVDLVIEYDSRFPALYAIDSSPLETDFEVLDTRSRVLRVTEDGEQFHRMQWRLQLLPRRTGELDVPSLSFGDSASPALKVEVRPLPEKLAAEEHVFLETRAEPIDPYPGQATHIVTRLFYNTPIGRGRIDEPDADDIVRFRHGQDYAYREVRAGREYRVLERRMAVIGGSSGALKLTPAQYRGRILHSSEAQADARQPGIRKINRRSVPVELQLRAPPDGYGGRYWLPATSLELKQRWAEPPDGLRVGDSLDWRLDIVATGLAARSLPENLLLTVADPTRYRVYPDRATRSDSFDGTRLTGRLEQKFVIVATEAGIIEMPEISLTWWDVGSGQERISRLEPARFEVGATSEADRAGAAADIPALPEPSAGTPTGWRIALVCIAMLAAIWLLGRFRDLLERRIYAPLIAACRYRQARYRLRRACLSGDAVSCRARLLEWARLRWPQENVSGLYWLCERAADDELVDELQYLDAALFAADPRNWQGRRLWQLLERHSRGERRAPKSQAKSALAELYPV